MELAKESLDDICGPSGTQHTGDDAFSGVTYPPRISAAPVTDGDSQVNNVNYASLYSHPSSDLMYLTTFLGPEPL